MSNYVLEICAEDSGVPTLSTSSFVNIEVSDINDNPPLFSEENYTAIVQVRSFKSFFFLNFTFLKISNIKENLNLCKNFNTLQDCKYKHVNNSGSEDYFCACIPTHEHYEHSTYIYIIY